MFASPMHFWKWLPFYSTHIAIITVALDCSATIPIQKAGKHGNSTQLTGLTISADLPTEELDLSLESETGYVSFLNLTGLQLLFTSDPHDVAVRGTVNALQTALQQVQYTSCVDCEAQIDTLRIRCAGGMMQSEATLQMDMDVVLPQLRASSLKHVIYNHSVLIIRDVTLQPAESTMQLELNISATSGTVAVEHDWRAPGAILTGTAGELNALLKSSGITFRPPSGSSGLIKLSLCLAAAPSLGVGDCMSMASMAIHVVGVDTSPDLPVSLDSDPPDSEAVLETVESSTGSVESDVLHVWMHAANEIPQLQPCNGYVDGEHATWFSIEEDAWEAPICVVLKDDADETMGSFFDLQVSVSVGLIHCAGVSSSTSRAGLFGTTCAGISSDPKSPPALGKPCELRSEVAMRPSLAEVQDCLRQLVYTPPSNFNGQVQMRIFVADNGFTSFLQGDQEEPKTFIQDLIIDVQAVNDMPYLYWVHLPPKEMLNNESFPFRNLRVEDPDVTGWRATASRQFTLTFQTGTGELLFPLGEALWKEQVPTPPWPSRYLRLQGTLQEIQDAFQRILYKPPEWFIGDDQILVSVSDGGLIGGVNLTGEVAFEVQVLQARIPVAFSMEKQLLKAKEDQDFRFGREGTIQIEFPAPKANLYLKISSADGALHSPRVPVDDGGTQSDEHLTFRSAASNLLEVNGSIAYLQNFLEGVHFRHPIQDWSTSYLRPAMIQLKTCQWDVQLEVLMADTCASTSVTIEVEAVDDTPVIFSVDYPWALPLHVEQDIPKAVCCFKVHDIDLRTSPTIDASWPFTMRIMAKYGNISLVMSNSVVLTQKERNLVSFQGHAVDLEGVLDTLIYTPPHNMSHHHGLDHLCLFLREGTGAVLPSPVRRYTGCWDVDIQPTPVPESSVMEQRQFPEPRAMSCGFNQFNVQNDSAFEVENGTTCERFIELYPFDPFVPMEDNESNVSEDLNDTDVTEASCNITGSCIVTSLMDVPDVMVEDLPEVSELSSFNPELPQLYNQSIVGSDVNVTIFNTSEVFTDDPRNAIFDVLTNITSFNISNISDENLSNDTTSESILQIYSLQSLVEVAQGSDLQLKNVLQVDESSPELWTSAGITSAPKYFHLQLDLADGLSFQSPMPVACGVLAATNVTNGKSTPWVLGREGQLPLEVQKSLGLHAPVHLLQQCIASLAVHIPWDTPVTAPLPSTGPSLMSTVPANGTVDVSTSSFQVLLTFNDWVEAGVGSFQIIDCGADDVCGQAATFDDTFVEISVHNTYLVTFNKNLVLITYPHRLAGLHLHQFRVPEGVIRDVSGNNFSGVAAENFTIRTALTGSSPVGWRLVASNISGTGADGWHVCELQFYLSTDCTTDQMQGTPAGSSEANATTFQDNSNYNASFAFDGQTSTCWWSNTNDPGSWLALYVKTPLYARSVKVQGSNGAVNPDEINVQFYVDGLWYTLQTFSYTESCVVLTSDFSTIFGNEYDTVAPEILSSIPDAASSLAVSETQRIVLYFSELVLVMSGSEMQLINAGDDGLCGTSDDGDIRSIPADLPTQYVRNGTDPWIYVTGNMILIRYPYLDMVRGFYHCLQVEPGIITDLAGTPFPGFRGDAFRFPVASTPFADATDPVFLATDPPTGSSIEGLQLITFKIFMSEAVVPCDATLMTQTAQIPGNHELYLISVFPNGTENPSGDRLTISFTPDPAVFMPHTFSISDSIITVSLNRSLNIGESYSIQIPENSLVDLSTTNIFDITGAPVLIPRNFAGLPLGEVIFHITEPVLERNPYKKSTVPVWAEAQTEMPRPMEAPLIPNKADLCSITYCNVSGNASDNSNASNESCLNDTNDTYTLLAVCGLTPQSGDGFEAIQQENRWLEDYHWLRVTADNGTSFQVELDVVSVNSPALIKARSPMIHVHSGVATLLTAEDGGPPLILEDDEHSELQVEVIFEPQGLIAILPSAWRDWTGRVNVTFDFPRVTPDYGSVGQGDWTPSTLEGKAAGKLTFYGRAISVQAALSNLTYQAPSDFEGFGLAKVVVRDGIYVREEVMMLVVRLPTSGLQISTSGQGSSVAYAYHEQSITTLGCDWTISDGSGALTGDATYHLSVYVVDPLACSSVEFRDCTSSATSGCTDWEEITAAKIQSKVSTDSGYQVLHLHSPRLEVLQFHLNQSLIFHPCNCTSMERFACQQTMFISVERRNRVVDSASLRDVSTAEFPNTSNETVFVPASQRSLGREDMAEGTCSFTVVSPLSVFLALRGPPLKMQEDGFLHLAERLYVEGHVPGPFWFTLGAENSSILAEGDGILMNGTKTYLKMKVNALNELIPMLSLKDVQIAAAQDFWGTDALYVSMESAIEPTNVSNVAGVSLSLAQNYSMMIEVLPTADLPRISVEHGSGISVAEAGMPHHINASISYHADFGAQDFARVHVTAPFGKVTFPQLDVLMDLNETSSAGALATLTEFFADDEFDADVEQEFVRKVPAREGQWPRISRYETSTGDGFTIAGSVTALNQVLSEIQLTPPADAPNSGSVSVTLHRTPTSTEPESMFPPGTFDTATAVAWGNLALQITPLSKSSSTCFIQGPAATFVKPGIDSRNMNITVYAETSASSQVTEEIASELHEFRISVRRGQISLDVNKFPAARICPPFYPDVGGCGMDELDAWVIYGRIADAALAIESLVYTPPFGFAGQDVMRISGSCSAVTLEMTLNIVKGFLPPLISCCNNGAVLEVHRALEPAPVPPCALENNAYGEIPAVAQVTFSSDLGQLAFWPVQGLYFDHGFDTIPMHNVSSQIVVDGPGTILQRGLASKLAMLHVPETEERTSGLLVIKVLDARSNLSSTSECPIHVSVGRREGLPNIYLDMPTPNASYLLSGALGPRRSHALRGMEMSIPSFGLVSAALRTPCLVKLQAHRGEILPPLRAPRRQAVEWTEEQRGNYTLLAESVQAANEVVSQLRFVVHEEEIDREPLLVPITISVFALPSGQRRDIDQAVLRDQRDLQLEIRSEPSIPKLQVQQVQLIVPRPPQRGSLAELQLTLKYPRSFVIQLSCDACTFFDGSLSSTSMYQLTGVAAVLEKHVASLQVEVTCAKCDAEVLLIRAWDPDTLQLLENENIPAQGNLMAQVSSQILLRSSPLARGPPVLRVESSGVVIRAGDVMELTHLSFRNADPNEPLGLHAVEEDVEVLLHCSQGMLELDVAALVSPEAYLSDAIDGASTAYAELADQVAESGMSMSAAPFHVPSANTRLAYVDASRPSELNGSLWAPLGATRPGRVIWSNSSLRLRGSAVAMQSTLANLKYTANERAGGWDTVVVSTGRQRGEIPLYIIRKAGDVLLKASPLMSMIAGGFLKPDVKFEYGPLVRPSDIFSAWVTCNHCGFALWPFAGEMEVIDDLSLEFSGNISSLQQFLSDLTYVPFAGFMGTDRLQIFVQGMRMQAAARATEPPKADFGMAIQVQLQEVVLPPANLDLPERLNVFEDSLTDLHVIIHDARPTSPSGVPLASASTENDGSSRPCVRAPGPYTWVEESVSSIPCDLFLVIGANGTSMDQLSCKDCTLRPAQLPDQCLTWVTGPVAITAQRPGGGWSVTACENASASTFPSQAFDHLSLPGGNGRFCVQSLDGQGVSGCFDSLVTEVTSQWYYGRPTVTRLEAYGNPLDCSGIVNMMTLPEENLTIDENVSFQLASQRCAGALSCEYIFDPRGLIDPAPGCTKELEVNYTCPNHQSYSSLARVYPGEVASLTIQCPVTFLPSADPLALHGSLPTGNFLLMNSINIVRLRQLTSCPNDWRPGVNVTPPVQAFESLVAGNGTGEFCIIGAPVALAEFAQHLRYQSRAHWSGSEPMRMTITAADNQSVIHAAEQTWIVVETTNDQPNITATKLTFQVRTGESVAITGIEISDADMSDKTRWMTLLVAASIGRLYLDPDFVLSPMGTLEPIQGRLDGDFALRVRGSGPDLQAFVDALRFSIDAPVKPSLTTRPLNQSETEAIISYVLSDTITQQAGALRQHQVAGKVVDPESDQPVEGVEVVLLARDTWHDYLGYTLQTACNLELVGWSVADCKTYAENNSYVGFTYGLSRAGGAQSCCFKSESVDLILMNLVAEASESLYIFQPGGYFVRTNTSAAGMYAALMPTGPADIYFTKALHTTRSSSIVVNDNIQVGGSADIYLQALAVVTIWRIEVDWRSLTGSPIDLDAHAFDAWDCHVYFANRICQHDGSHGLTVTLNRDNRDVIEGKEVITVHQWPCDSIQAAIGGYRDIWSCLAYFWVQIFSYTDDVFSNVEAKVSIFRQGTLVQEFQLPADGDPNDFWVGFVLDWGSSTIQSYKNETGNASLAEDFVGGRGDYELPPSQDVRRLAGDPTVGSLPLKRPVGRMRTTGRGSRLEAWRELLQKDWNHEKHVEMEGPHETTEKESSRRLQSTDLQALYVPSEFDRKALEGTGLIFTLDYYEKHYTACQVSLPADKLLPYPPPSWARKLVLPDDGAIEIPLPSSMKFYEQTFTSVFIGSNGYVTFGQPSSNRSSSYDAHFSRPGFSALGHDLAPHRSGSSIWLEIETVDLLDTRVVITFENVQTFSDRSGNSNSFQIVLFIPTNQVMVSYQRVSDAAAMAKAAIGVAPAIFPALGVQFLPGDTICSNACANWVRESFLEECDIGNVLTEGCDSTTCRVLPGYTCNKVLSGVYVSQPRMDLCVPVVCGNGLRETGEQCDDRNVRDGDGCSSTCQVELGYTCSRSDSAHVDVCHGQQPIFTEDFSTSTFDLEGQMLIFKPSADTKHQNKYEMCKQPLLNSLHPDVPSSAAEKLKIIEDSDSVHVLFPEAFPFFGSSWTSAWVNSNGVITFERPYESDWGTLEGHFLAPRVAALFADLAPQDGGSIFFEIINATSDRRVVITYEGLSEFGVTNSASSFQVAFYFDGQIRVSWSSVKAAAPFVGVSSGAPPSRQSLHLETGYLLLNESDLMSAGVKGEYSANVGLYTQDMTWEFWYKLGSLGTRIPIITNAISGLFSIGLLYNERLFLDVNETGYLIVGAQGRTEYKDQVSVSPIVANKWLHIAVVVDRGAPCSANDDPSFVQCSRIEVYVDLVRMLDLRLGTSGGGANAGITFYDSFEGLAIGGNELSSNVPKSIAQFRIYTRALTKDELGSCTYANASVVNLLMSYELNGNFMDLGSDFPLSLAPGTVAYYKYDIPEACTSTVEKDDLSSAGICVPSATCGDGFREAFEACDDGNAVSGDGCSDFCQVEVGFSCMDVTELPTTTSPNSSNDSNVSLTISNSSGTISYCQPSICGDGVLGNGEECDDGNVNSFDGCSGCIVEPGYYCTQPTGSLGPSTCVSRCGDGRRVVMFEDCDDANTVSGDGCSGSCTIEAGYICDEGTEMVRDYCYPKCGDGMRVPHEQCDDGNTQSGDGCSSTCVIETGYACHGGNSSHSDSCNLTVCGDGLVEGAEECDDFNDFGGDGCSATCLREIKEVSSNSDSRVTVSVLPLGQLCRIYNARRHETMEDTTYHLQNTIVTGDVSQPDDLRIRIRVLNGSIAMKPLVDIYLSQGRNDSVWEAIVERETGVRFYPYADNMKDTIISGNHFQVDRFLRYYVYILPDLDFSGYIQVLFNVMSGMVMNHGAEVCESNVVIRVLPVYNDPTRVIVEPSIQSDGFQCVASSTSCSFAGISLHDSDCEQIVDGSCFLKLDLNVSLGFLQLPGHPDGWQAVVPSLIGHPAGLNAALARMLYFPPALPPADPIFQLTVERVIQRDIATPEELHPMNLSLSLPISILNPDTAPTVRLASGEPFHGAVFEMNTSRPYIFTNLIFEPQGSMVTTCIVEISVSKGFLFLGDMDGLSLANGTENGEPRLRFIANSSDIRNRFLSDVRYTWDDDDCSTLEQLNITVDSGRHEALTLTALLVLPECQGYSAQWWGTNSLTMMEDSEISIGHLNLSTRDEHLFLMVNVKQIIGPSMLEGGPGDCKVLRWPEEMASFKAGRECHLDGLVKGLNEALPYLVYKPPPDFFGQVQLEFEIFKTNVADEIMVLQNNSRDSYQNIFVDIMVLGKNDGPTLDIQLDTYRLPEDLEDYFVLGPLFVSDVDADQHFMSFKFELVEGHQDNLLMVCGLLGTLIVEPHDYILDDQECLTEEVSRIRFNTTVQNFNSMQTGPGRLQFKAARNWHGSAVINITVDDRGSGHGLDQSLLVQRSLYLTIEPVIDTPELSILCPEKIPFVTYDRNCLEVSDCFALNASLDQGDVALSFWLIIKADDPRVQITVDRAPLQVWDEGTSELHMAGLYHNVQETLKALKFRPPGHLFDNAYDPHTFQFNVSITAYALGEIFNEPWHPNLLTSMDVAYPSDMLEFTVEVRRINRPPLFFVDRPSFSVTQLQDDVVLPGVVVAEPDVRREDLLEIVIWADLEADVGMVSFGGQQGMRLQQQMNLQDLNEALQNLTFVFNDVKWFGVTGVSLWVSDLGNHGWRVDRKANPQNMVDLQSQAGGAMTASTFLAVHRSFVNERPQITLREPKSGMLQVFEDHAQFVSFSVTHKATELLVDREITAFIRVSHGKIQSISAENETTVTTHSQSHDGKRLEYRAYLYELNIFLAQVQFMPDPNYFGPDELLLMVTDGQYVVNASVPIQITSLTDPVMIHCPPAVDLFEGQVRVPIGANISIRDYEPLPGATDENSKVEVEIFVGDGGLHLDTWEMFLGEVNESEDVPGNSSMPPGVATYNFNTTLQGFRHALRALQFTPYPALYHGVVHLEVRVSMLETTEFTRCEIGLVVHPVNSPPKIHVNEMRLLAATNGGIVKPHKNVHLHGVLRLSDPDEEDFSGGWFVERTHSARLKLNVSCGTMSFLIAGTQDYVSGVQNGSIAGTEGITFHSGDGAHDTDMDISSTLANLNLQLGRLYYHSGACREQNVTISAELDDLGNFGASMDEMGNYGHPHPIVVTNQLHFMVAEY